MKMSQESIKELLMRMKPRYAKAGRGYKGRLLGEFCDYTGYSRKHACKLLNGSLPPRRNPPGRKKTYDGEVKEVLKAIWLASDQLCSKLLKPVMGDYLRGYERVHGPLEAGLRAKLEAISPASIDRLLAGEKVDASRWQAKRRINNPVRDLTPLRCEPWAVGEPGWIEADTVAHCGGSMAGSFTWSLTCTDIVSAWTVCRAIWNCGAHGVKERFGQLEPELPFAVLGVDTDNGGEFLNWPLHDYFREREQPVELTRSRAYRKNDNAHVEQKNSTHVRRLLGHDRFEDPRLVELIDALYTEAWNPYKNFFSPTFRLKEKKQVGGKYIKRYEKPKTPCQRLMESAHITKEVKAELKRQYESLDPFELKQDIERRLKEIFEFEQIPMKGRCS